MEAVRGWVWIFSGIAHSPTQLCMKRSFHQSHRQGKPTCSSTLPSQQLLLVFFFFLLSMTDEKVE